MQDTALDWNVESYYVKSQRKMGTYSTLGRERFRPSFVKARRSFRDFKIDCQNADKVKNACKGCYGLKSVSWKNGL
jgi:hypothetical protein